MYASAEKKLAFTPLLTGKLFGFSVVIYVSHIMSYTS